MTRRLHSRRIALISGTRSAMMSSWLLPMALPHTLYGSWPGQMSKWRKIKFAATTAASERLQSLPAHNIPCPCYFSCSGDAAAADDALLIAGHRQLQLLHGYTTSPPRPTVPTFSSVYLCASRPFLCVPTTAWQHLCGDTWTSTCSFVFFASAQSRQL